MNVSTKSVKEHRLPPWQKKYNNFFFNKSGLPVFALNIRHIKPHAQLPGVHILRIRLAWTAHHLAGTAAAWTAAHLARTAVAAIAGTRGATPNKLPDFVARGGHVVVPVQVRSLLPVVAGGGGGVTLQFHALGPPRSIGMNVFYFID